MWSTSNRPAARPQDLASVAVSAFEDREPEARPAPTESLQCLISALVLVGAVDRRATSPAASVRATATSSRACVVRPGLDQPRVAARVVLHQRSREGGREERPGGLVYRKLPVQCAPPQGPDVLAGVRPQKFTGEIGQSRRVHQVIDAGGGRMAKQVEYPNAL